MVHFRKMAALILLVCTVSTAQAEGTNDENSCALESQSTISLSFVESVAKDGDLGAIYKEKVSLINDIAKKNDFQKYKITSQDMSSSRSSYGDEHEVYISISIQISSDYDAITTLFGESGAYSFSSSQLEVEVCDD